MKKIYTIILAAVATLFSTSLAFADGDSYTPEQLAALSATKTVKPIGDGSQFQLTLETFVKGYSFSSTAKSSDMDIVLLLDVSGSMSGTKMDNLHKATKQFIDIIAENATKHKANHRISIVKFGADKTDKIGIDYNPSQGNRNYTQIVNEFMSVNTEANVSTLKGYVDLLKATGYTHSDYGMDKAKDAFARKRDDAILSMVVFTDGVPGESTSTFDDQVGSDAVKGAKDIKDMGVTVYTIGLFDNGTQSTKVSNYMMAMSSDYPEAVYEYYYNSRWDNGYRWKLGTKAAKEYYHATNDASELSNIFTEIGEDIGQQGVPGIDLPVNDVTIQDIVTPAFELPAGANSITLKVAQIKDVHVTLSADKKSWSVADDVDYDWEAPITIWKDGANVSPDPYFADVAVADLESAPNTINVTGFDFTKYWVGPDVEKLGDVYKDNPKTNTNGRKLIIEIIIQLDPNYSGTDSQITTNDTENSGIYVAGKGTKPVKNYAVVPATVYAPLPLKITKAGGLELGESILYTIERGTMVGGVWTKDETFSTMTVALTKDSNDGSLSETLGRLPARKMVNGEYVDYLYKVTEDTTWAWAHKTSTPVVKTQKLFDSESNYVPVSFDFATAPDTAGTIRKDEKARANEFGK